MVADVPLSGLQSVRLSRGFRGLIEAPIRAHKCRVAWKDVAVFHYQPRGDEHGAEYPEGACISSTQTGRDTHGAFADGSIHRCDAAGKNGKGDAAYLLHLDGIPAWGAVTHPGLTQPPYQYRVEVR